MENADPVQIVSILITPKIVGHRTVKEALDRLPVAPRRTSAIALPEPEDDDPGNGEWAPSLD